MTYKADFNCCPLG